MAATRPKRPPVFTYPRLPEIKLCWAVTVAAIVYAWYRVYETSQQMQWQIGDHASVKNLPLVGKRFKDEANWEWLRWSPYAFSYLPIYIGHCLLFNIGSAVLPDQVFTWVYTLSASATLMWKFSPLLFGYSFAQGIVIFTASYFFPTRLTVWLSSLPILYYMMHYTLQMHDDIFLVLFFVSYSLLSYISYCLEIIDGPVRKEDDTFVKRLVRMFFFAFYQPYMVSLIILYPDFERQIIERQTKQRNFKDTIIFAIRIAFWWLVCDLLLHFCYFESILNHVGFAAKIDKNSFVAMGMALGQFFHVKYVVIFGLPSLFAKIDNMDPLPGPMCLARVCLYSNVWRCFDRGLYQFFKRYIFVPICAPDFTVPKKIVGIFISYGFVLLWHGFHHNNIVWILLNIAALFMEMSAKIAYSTPSIRSWLNARLSALSIRRILGWLQIIPFAFGLYSNFYFLGGSHVGSLYVDRVLIEETLPVRPFFLALISIGYCYTQTCMEVDRWQDEKEAKKHVE